MSVFLSFTVLGIVFGAVYGILAIGLVVTYNTTGVFNFAQGAVGMVAAFSYWQLWQDWHWPFLVAVAVIVLVEAPLLAVAVEYVLFRRIHGATVERSLMVSLGLLVILLGVATIFWSSPDVTRSVPPYFTQSDGTVLSIRLFGTNGVTLQYQQIMIVVVTAVVGVVLGAFVPGPARRGHAGRRRRPRVVALAVRRPAAPDGTDGLGLGLHARRPGRLSDRSAGGADRVDVDAVDAPGPERVRGQVVVG